MGDAWLADIKTRLDLRRAKAAMPAFISQKKLHRSANFAQKVGIHLPMRQRHVGMCVCLVNILLRRHQSVPHVLQATIRVNQRCRPVAFVKKGPMDFRVLRLASNAPPVHTLQLGHRRARAAASPPISQTLVSRAASFVFQVNFCRQEVVSSAPKGPIPKKRQYLAQIALPVPIAASKAQVNAFSAAKIQPQAQRRLFVPK